jgi:ribosomal protein L11 methyltransferase
MHIWQKFVTAEWLARNECHLNATTSGRHAVIRWPHRKRILVECSCRTIGEARELVKTHGGSSYPLPLDWMEKLARQEKRKPLTIGKRLAITNVGGTSLARRSLLKEAAPRQLRRRGTFHLVIPAGAAFGTGDHATTAMSLRLLEEVSRKMETDWSLVDLGTGSGILALAAKCFGAKEVVALDNDEQAIRIAKQNARSNKIRGIEFHVRDALRSKDRHKKFDLITANLFSDLLIKALPIWRPQLKPNGRMILSGIFREQEPQLLRALRRHRLSILKIRRRGKWVAMVAALADVAAKTNLTHGARAS